MQNYSLTDIGTVNGFKDAKADFMINFLIVIVFLYKGSSFRK